MLLKWNVVSRGSSVIQRYVIRYSLGRGSAWIKQVNISPSVTYYLLKNLFPSTTYYVELQASNTDFISAPSVVQVTTQKSGRSGHDYFDTCQGGKWYTSINMYPVYPKYPLKIMQIPKFGKNTPFTRLICDTRPAYC